MNIHVENYEIRRVLSPISYMLVEHITVQKGDRKGEQRESILGYYPRPEGALEKVVRELTDKDLGTISLEGYVTRLETITKQIKERVINEQQVQNNR